MWPGPPAACPHHAGHNSLALSTQSQAPNIAPQLGSPSIVTTYTMPLFKLFKLQRQLVNICTLTKKSDYHPI